MVPKPKPNLTYMGTGWVDDGTADHGGQTKMKTAIESAGNAYISRKYICLYYTLRHIKARHTVLYTINKNVR